MLNRCINADAWIRGYQLSLENQEIQQNDANSFDSRQEIVDFVDYATSMELWTVWRWKTFLRHAFERDFHKKNMLNQIAFVHFYDDNRLMQRCQEINASIPTNLNPSSDCSKLSNSFWILTISIFFFLFFSPSTYGVL